MGDWRITSRWKPESGSGTAVENDSGQLGYAKSGNLSKERLAAYLAAKLELPVPHVEEGTVGGKGSYVISHVKNDRVVVLGKPHESRDLTDHEKDATRAGSIIIPFLAWIYASDHSSDANYAFEDQGSGCRLIAFDFENAFEFNNNIDKIYPFRSLHLRTHFEPALIEAALLRIEGFDPAEIRHCCEKCQLPFADILDRRRSKVRSALSDHHII